ncbi:DUF3696 domain-containing protein [Xenorhabdus bovienii]|nr:DUF3696 domain-containing protein [Xenorhabdus bovienii]
MLDDGESLVTGGTSSQYLKLINKFYRGLTLSNKIFGEIAFRKERTESNRSPISKSLFEILVTCLSELDDAQAKIVIEKNDELIDTFYNAIRNDSEEYAKWDSARYKDEKRGFLYSISTSTGKKVTIKYRFEAFIEILKKSTGVNIELINFKAYKKQKFNFSNLTVFCGNNSVGKSTAIQAIGILLQSEFSSSVQINGELVQVGDLEDIHNFDNKDEDYLSICIKSSYINGTWGYTNADDRENPVNNNILKLIQDEQKNNNYSNVENTNEAITYQYLQAERYGPRNNLPLSQHSHNWEWLGTKGEHTIEILETLFARARRNLTSHNDKNGDPRRHPSMSTHNVFNNIEAWMGEISPNYKMNPKKNRDANVSYNSIISTSGNATKPINIGFGYSYALSIITALLLAPKGQVVIIESPEAHLHPKGQSYLGRLIALSALSGIQIIVETHSDHLLNGIRVIARTHDDFDPNIFNLYYISYDEELNENKVDKIKLSKDGKLSDWPKGFFDQQASDMFTIMTGRKKEED